MIIYFLKKKIHGLLSFLLCLTSFSISSYFFLPRAVSGLANASLYSTSENSEVWFARSPIQNDCFQNLNGSNFAFKEGENINADLFMQMEDASYESNLFDVKSILNPKECAISKNISVIYSLEIGDSIYVKDENNSFVVCKIFAAQSGLDPKYQHDGVIILPPNENLTSARTTKYVFFTNELESAYEIDQVISLSNEAQSYREEAIANILKLLLAYSLTILVSDALIFRHELRNYRLEAEFGIHPTKLFKECLFDSCLRILVPILLVPLFYFYYELLFTSAYWIFFSLFASFGIILFIFITIIYFRKGNDYGQLHRLRYSK